MATGYSIKVGDIEVRTSEALYQACRFPNSLDVQKMIIEQKSPMMAKMKSKPFRPKTRPDWDMVKVKIMQWCIRAKLACNYYKFRDLLLSTGDKSIVEDSHRDRFWGAISQEDGSLVGENVLGRLLMELREELKVDKMNNLKKVQPLKINDFNLLGHPIPIIGINDDCNKIIEKEEKDKKLRQLQLFNKE
ncbi:MAG: Type I restriction-modification system, specificity subunit S [Candidatus Jettenia ecosi]|uniref:Type I restriction-modification system, specificity subunit S n=1 Tax=Candidatus Jettenia ecosi TaxID=2494326 RepID=A0A533QNA8_9BACT|nr:MAG: Type I restriction-modification system, specificity subunit S [Candidatus Jettenia ecosi]